MKAQSMTWSQILSAEQTQTLLCVWCERAGSYVRLILGVGVFHACIQSDSLSDFPSLSTQMGVTAALLTTTVGVISVNQTWGQEWDVIPISLQVSRPKHSLAPKPRLTAT